MIEYPSISFTDLLLTHEEQQKATDQFRQDTNGQEVTLWQLIEFQFRYQIRKVLEVLEIEVIE